MKTKIRRNFCCLEKLFNKSCKKSKIFIGFLQSRKSHWIHSKIPRQSESNKAWISTTFSSSLSRDFQLVSDIFLYILTTMMKHFFLTFKFSNLWSLELSTAPQKNNDLDGKSLNVFSSCSDYDITLCIYLWM